MKAPFLTLVILSLVISTGAILGWLSDIPLLYSFGIMNTSMKLSTALFTCTLNVAILLFSYKRTIIAYSLLAILLIVCVLTFIQYLLNPSLPYRLPIEELAFEKPSLFTITGFFLTVMGIILINLKKFYIGQALGVLVILQMFASIMGLTFGVDELYYFNEFSAISFPAALVILCSAISTLLLQPNEGLMEKFFSKRSSGYTARFAILYFLIVTPAYVTIYIYLTDTAKADIIFLILGLIVVSLPLFYSLIIKLNRVDRNLQLRNDELQRLTNKLIESNVQVTAQNKELTDNNEDLNNILHIISHDLKIPITGLQGSLQVLKKRMSDKGEPDDMKLLLTGVNSVEKLKTTIINLSNLIKAKTSLKNEGVIDLKQMTDEIQSDFSDEIQSSHATLRISLAGQYIKYDRISLLSILQNLISNAIKYRSPNRRPIIDISFFRTGTGTYLIVSDNGSGIPESKIHQLFTIYSRFHSHVEGTGIGLYLIKRLIERRGGTIRVDSSEGDGTKFTVFLGEDLFVNPD